MDLQLAGKKVLITGASQGIGEGLAEVFAEEGCNLHLVARSGAKLEALGERIRRGHGVKVVVQQQDIGAAGAGDAIARAVGHVDILVNNAGAIPAGDLWHIDAQAWREGWQVKVFGYIDLCRTVYATMKTAGGGVILNNIGNTEFSGEPATDINGNYQLTFAATGTNAPAKLRIELDYLAHRTLPKDLLLLARTACALVAKPRELDANRG